MRADSGPVDEVRQSTDLLLSLLKAIPPAAGFEEVLVPSEPEERTRERRLRERVPLPATILTELQALAGERGVSISA